MNAITIENLSKAYGKGKNQILALNDISISVPQGSIYGFIGPNGAGKSTSISIILQFLYQYQGKVFLFDQEVTPENLPVLKNQIGFIPDADLPNINGVKFLKHTAYYHGLQGSQLKQSLRAIVDLLDIRGFIGRNTKRLSKGQKTKIKIANALIGNPSLIIADEPTSGLHQKDRREFLTLISQLRTEYDTSIFFSNHVIGEVEKICDQVAIISKGYIVTQGTIESIIHSLPVKNRFNIVAHNLTLTELEKLPGVISVFQKSPFEFIIETSETNGGVPNFIKELVQKPISLESFSREMINLEDIFLSVVNK